MGNWQAPKSIPRRGLVVEAKWEHAIGRASTTVADLCDEVPIIFWQCNLVLALKCFDLGDIAWGGQSVVVRCRTKYSSLPVPFGKLLQSLANDLSTELHHEFHDGFSDIQASLSFIHTARETWLRRHFRSERHIRLLHLRN
jgi:hypothetical protein